MSVFQGVFSIEQHRFSPPIWWRNASIFAFFLTIIICQVAFYGHSLPLRIWFFDVVSVVGFFFAVRFYTIRNSTSRPIAFEQHLFASSFLIRAIFVIFIYFYNMSVYDNYWGAGLTDVTFYVPTSLDAARRHGLNFLAIYHEWISWHIQISDCGYMLYLSMIYAILHGSQVIPAYEALILPEPSAIDIIVPLLLKSLWGALTCLSVYRCARRGINEKTARLSGIFCMVCPNMIWWCGSMMKETEMVFLSLLFVNYADKLIRTRKFSWQSILPIVASVVGLFLFRTALAVVALLAFSTALILTSSKVVGFGKRFSLIVVVVATLFALAGNRVASEVQLMVDRAPTSQQADMATRVRRDHGNSFAKYAGASVFAPIIFTLPFPTLSYTYFEQEQIMQNAGGNFIKNVTSFFVLFALLCLLFSGDWRKHVLILAFLMGYLLVLVFSNFAQSGRFHMPIVPLEMMFAAYGLTLFPYKYKNFYTGFLIFEFLVCCAWQWFKLKGQGIL